MPPEHSGRERRDRSASPARKHHKHKGHRHHDSSDEDNKDNLRIRLGKDKISEDDFYKFGGSFKRWLSNDKGKYLDKLSTKDAERYFSKFVKAWNKGKLSKDIYSSSGMVSDKSMSSYKWNIKGISKAEEKLLSTSHNVNDDGNDGAFVKEPYASSSTPSYGRQGGSSSLQAVQEKREQERESREQAREKERYDRRKQRREERDEERDNRATGRERLIEKKAEKRHANAEFASRKDDVGLEMDDDVLMGGSNDSFKAALAARDAARERGNRRKDDRDAERRAEREDKARAFKEKEDATMAMFKDLAKARFG